MMLRVPLLCAALAAPIAAPAQSLPERPRALDVFASVQGYPDLAPDRFGTPADPARSELGALLLLRIFRNVCLGLEQGAPLAEVLLDPFSAYVQGPYLLGRSTPGTEGNLVLSATGSVDADETEGHPTVWLSEVDSGVRCTAEWRVAGGFPEDRRGSMAYILQDWMPWEFAMVRAMGPLPTDTPPASAFLEWDRPCGPTWCPVTVNYSLERGDIVLETTLAIQSIAGSR